MGFVYDAEGKLPVAGAKVWAEYDGPTAGILRETTTDDKGWFALTQVQPGPYWVIADKEEEGYPDPINALYNCPWWQFPKVTVKDKQSPIEVTLNLCPKVGKLKVHVVDADTGLALKAGMYGVELAENPQVTSGGSSRWPGGDLILLLPPSPCRLKIFAPGYETWYYGKDRSEKGSELITLPAWTTRELTVLLKRPCQVPP